MDEFALIRRHFLREPVSPSGLAPKSGPGSASVSAAVTLGIGDDAALLTIPAGEVLAVTTDTLVAGRHFPLDTSAYAIGWKALAVNLSDLAAMAASPSAVTLALTLPEADEAWLSEFCAGFFALADAESVPLIGGDTTRGPLSITVTALGSVPAARALLRSGARAGDHVFVSGTVGDAGLGLALALSRQQSQQARAQVNKAQTNKAQAGHPEIAGDKACASWSDRVPLAHQDFALQRLNRPSPRLALGLALRELATAALDISDGLAQDLGHILAASGVGADLCLDALPLSPGLRQLAAAGEHAQVLQWALSAGDDYELLFTVPPEHLQQMPALASHLALALTDIGTLSTEPGLRMSWQGQPWQADHLHGYQHFLDSDHD